MRVVSNLVDELMRLAELVDIPYTGGTLQGVVRAALDKLLARRKRRYLSAAEKTEVLARQAHTCNLCGTAFGEGSEKPEFDHVVPKPEYGPRP